MSDMQQPPPEAVVIRRAREARGLSPERAASLLEIPLSGARWRQIEQGYEIRAGGRKAVKGRDMVIAHMAHVVGLRPEALQEAGRPEAAQILREILGEPANRPERPERRYDDPGLQKIWEITELTEWERRLAITAVLGWRAHADQAGDRGIDDLRDVGM